jgi:hypothetical protein
MARGRLSLTRDSYRNWLYLLVRLCLFLFKSRKGFDEGKGHREKNGSFANSGGTSYC